MHPESRGRLLWIAPAGEALPQRILHKRGQRRPSLLRHQLRLTHQVIVQIQRRPHAEKHIDLPHFCSIDWNQPGVLAALPDAPHRDFSPKNGQMATIH